MAERFERLYRLPDNLYSYGSPVIVAAGALLKDKQTGGVIAQLKFQSLSPVPIKALKVSLAAYDVTGEEITGVEEYQYLDLKISNGQTFGSNKAIVMPHTVTRSFAVTGITAVLTDGSAEIAAMPLAALPEAVPLKDALGDSELVKQYRLAVNGKVICTPQEADDLWLCSCGQWNSCDSCTQCGAKDADVFSAYNIPALTERMTVRLANEKAQQKEQERLAKIKRKKATLFTVIAILIITLAVLISAIPLIPSASNNDVTDPRAESNFNNKARFAFDENSLYFVALYNEEDDGTSVYSTSYTGENKKLISDNNDINKIRIANGKILYETYGNSTYSIGVMEKDGSNNFVIIELKSGSNDYLDDFDVSGSTLYYLYNGELRICSMDGTDDTLLVDDVEEFILDGNTLYYCSETSIFSYNIKKSKSAKICNAKASGLVLDGDRIFFRNASGIYSVSVSGEDAPQMLVKDGAVNSFAVHGEEIYYLQSLDNDTLTELAKRLDEDNYLSVVVILASSGQIECIPKSGGIPNAVDSNQLLAEALYVYPGGMYSRLSFLSDALSYVEFN